MGKPQVYIETMSALRRLSRENAKKIDFNSLDEDLKNRPSGEVESYKKSFIIHMMKEIPRSLIQPKVRGVVERAVLDYESDYFTREFNRRANNESFNRLCEEVNHEVVLEAEDMDKEETVGFLLSI